MGVAGFASSPRGMDFRAMLGLGMLGGIGFTMSLFIGSLAFSREPLLYTESVIGVLVASKVSAVIGYAWLRMVLKPQHDGDRNAQRAGVRRQQPDRAAAAPVPASARLACDRGVATQKTRDAGSAQGATGPATRRSHPTPTQRT